MRIRTILILVKRLRTVALGVVLSACAAGAPAPGDGLYVVASTTVLGDVLAELVGEDGRVDVLMPRGADPHDFQPSARQAALLREADLVVVNGLGLEEGLLDVVAAAGSEGVAVVELGPQLDPLRLPETGHDHESEEPEGDHEDGALDPHVWLDPVRMAEGVTILGERLAEADDRVPDARWQERARRYRESVLNVHVEVEALLEPIPPEGRRLVTNHHSLGYFAERYGFRVVATVIPADEALAEPSARDLAGLSEVLEREGVEAIFAETTRPSRLAETVAAEVGRPVEVVVLYTDSLGEPGSGAETYLGMLRVNAERIARALGQEDRS